MLEVNFWQDKIKSKKIIKEKKLFEELIKSFNESNLRIKDIDDLYKLAVDENNEDIKNDIYSNLKELRILVKKK